MNTTEEANVGLVRRLYEALNQNQHELLSSVVSDDVAFHGATEQRGVQAYAALTERLRVAFPDMQFTLLDLIASDDRVVVRWTMDATHEGPLAGIAATGKRVQQRGNVIYRCAEGKMAGGLGADGSAGHAASVGHRSAGNCWGRCRELSGADRIARAPDFWHPIFRFTKPFRFT